MTRMNPKNLVVLVVLVSLIIGIVLTSGCNSNKASTAAPETQAQTIATVTPEEADSAEAETQAQIIDNVTVKEAFTLIQNSKDNPNFIILDVRTPEEFVSEHIKDAINLDYYSETFRDDLNNLDKHKTYLIYCRSGRRSGDTLDTMQDLNFMEVYNVLGGINSWKTEGFPTVRKSRG